MSKRIGNEQTGFQEAGLRCSPRTTAAVFRILTVHHLKNAVVAKQSRRKLVLHVHDVSILRRSLGQFLGDTLSPLAGRVDVVAPREVGIDGAVDRVAICPGKGVLVEALLPWGACSAVPQPCGVAEEKLQMALVLSRGAPGGGVIPSFFASFASFDPWLLMVLFTTEHHSCFVSGGWTIKFEIYINMCTIA